MCLNGVQLETVDLPSSCLDVFLKTCRLFIKSNDLSLLWWRILALTSLCLSSRVVGRTVLCSIGSVLHNVLSSFHISLSFFCCTLLFKKTISFYNHMEVWDPVWEWWMRITSLEHSILVLFHIEGLQGNPGQIFSLEIDILETPQ